MAFFKVFDTEALGEVIVAKDTNEDGDYVILIMSSLEDFVTLKTYIGFPNEESANRAFEEVTQEFVDNIARNLRDYL